MVFSRLCLCASLSCLLAFSPSTTHALDQDQIKAGLESLMKMTPERQDPSTVEESLQDLDRKTEELRNMFSGSEGIRSRLDSIGKETKSKIETRISASKGKSKQAAKEIGKTAKSEAEGVRSRPVEKEGKSQKSSKKTSASNKKVKNASTMQKSSKEKVKDFDPELVKGLDLESMLKGLDPELIPPIDDLLKHKDPDKRDPAELERMARTMLEKWKQKGYGLGAGAPKSESKGTSEDEEDEHARDEKEQRGTSGHDEL